MINHLSYLIINIGTVCIPLLFWKFEKLPSRNVFNNYWTAVITAGVGFIIWDIFVTSRGHWSFNSDYTLGIKLFNLPLEEILFFICIPFSSLYLFEVLHYFVDDKKLNIHSWFFVCIGIIILLFGIVFLTGAEYSLIITLIVALLFIFSPAYSHLFQSKNFWVYQALMLIPFGLVNSILTSLPIVKYNVIHITNIRIGTMPIEDFLYSFALLTTYLIAYQKSKKLNVFTK